MPGTHALTVAIALADCLETYTSEVRLENIVSLADALERSGRVRNLPVFSPRDLGNLIDALPVEVLRMLKPNGTSGLSVPPCLDRIPFT